jgi:hypothetical protein
MIYQIIGFFLVYVQIDRITDNQIIRFASIVYMLLLSINALNKTVSKFPYSKITFLFYLFVTMNVIAMFRSSGPVATPQNIAYEIVSYLVNTIFIVSTTIQLSFRFKIHSWKILMITFFYPIGIYVSLNLLFWVLGIKITNFQVVEEIGKAVMLSSLGIDMDRVIFPLSGGGLNTYSDFLGAFLVFCLALMAHKKIKFIYLLMVGLTVVSMLMVDSRSFLINAALATIAIYFLIKSRFSNYLKYAPIILIISPFFLLAYLPIIYKSLSAGVLRSTESSDSVDRVIIWGKSALELTNFKIEHIFGFGEYGHFGSKVSKQWAYLFTEWANPDYASPHNTFFSIVFDYGYLGVVLYFLVIQNSIKSALQIYKAGYTLIAASVLAFWMYYLVSGATETLDGLYSPGVIYLFQAALIISEVYKISSKNIVTQGKTLVVAL